MEGEAHCNAVTLVPDDQIFLFSPFLGQSEVQCNILAGGALCRGIFGHGNRINPRQSLIKSVTTSTTFSQSRHSQGTRSIQRRAIPRMADQPQWRQSQGTRTIPRNQGSPKETGQSQGSRSIPRNQGIPNEGNPKEGNTKEDNPKDGRSTQSNTINWKATFYAASTKMMGCQFQNGLKFNQYQLRFFLFCINAKWERTYLWLNCLCVLDNMSQYQLYWLKCLCIGYIG